MRQAGRSLPEYRAIRATIGMLDSCLTPDVASEITLQPIRRHGVDAAIFFSDIVIPLKLAGLPIDIVAGVGPVLDTPIRTKADLHLIAPLDPASLDPIREAIGIIIEELGSTPLIGFGGAPFTLASYLIEGGPSKTLPVSRAMMADDPDTWNAILTWCSEVTSQFIRAQVESGASALQVFDSWAGRLTPSDYRQFAKPHSTHLLHSLSDLVDNAGAPVPRVHFGVGTGAILSDMCDAGATVMGVDSETSLQDASELFGHHVPLQGNISTEALEWPWEKLSEHVDQVLEDGESAPGHVVNLGHGVPKDTDPDVLTRIVAHIHEAATT
jgi:uroporphyrinogen decarboxylase